MITDGSSASDQFLNCIASFEGEDQVIADSLSSLSCAASDPQNFPSDPLSLTPPGSPLGAASPNSPSEFGFPSLPSQEPQSPLDTQSSLWLDDLKTLGHGHVQKLVDSWEAVTHSLEPHEQKKEATRSHHPIVQPLIEYWDAKEKEIVLVSCSGAPGHAHCSGSSLDTESKIKCLQCSSKPSIQTQETENEPLQSSRSDQLLYPSVLPEDSFEREPRFVNPKQYNRILKRRQQRAKYFQKHVVVKQAKPYKHQSRHDHAQRRQRGQGGRFMKKQLSEPDFPDSIMEPFPDFFSFGALAA